MEGQDMTPEEAKAAMGNATFLVEGMLGGGQPTEQAQTEEKPQVDMEAMGQMVASIVDEKLSVFKQELQEALVEDDELDVEED